MQRFYEALKDANGNPAYGVSAYVYNAQTGALATIYSDSQNLLNPTGVIANPIVTDASGEVKFAVPNGYYTIRYTGGNIAARNRTFVSLADQSVQSQLGYWIDGSEYFTAAELADITTGAGLLDVSSGLNTAIQAAITNQKRLVLPTGVYSIGSPLMLMKWSGSAFSFFNVHIMGDKSAYFAEAPYVKSVVIRPTFKDVPAICIQNGRSVVIENISIQGLNTFSIGNGITSPNYPELMTNTTYINNGVRDSRYSPYAGIAIDPFGSSVPADGGYPGLSAYYANGSAGSSRVTLRDVGISNFTCGVVISPNGDSVQADMISFENCSIWYCKTGVSNCQSQARGITWRGGDVYFCLYGFDGVTYGAQEGYAPSIFGVIMSGKYLFNTTNNFQTQVFSGIEAESFGSIGFLGSTNQSPHPVTFRGCEFQFSNFGGIFADWHCFAVTPVLFDGCHFAPPCGSYRSPLRFFSADGTGMRFKSCSFFAGSGTFLEFPLNVSDGVATRQWENVYFDGCVFIDSGRGQYHNQIGGHQRHFTVSQANGMPAVAGTTYEFLYSSDYNKMMRVVVPDNDRSIGTLSVTVGANGTATFTVADGAVVNDGDLIFNATSTGYENAAGTTTSYTWNAIGIVTNVATNDVTISGVPQSLVDGSYALRLAYIPRFHESSTGDLNSSTSVTNVSPTGAWKNGQHIRATGIPEGTYIASGGGTATLTLSKAATVTKTGVSLYDAVLEDIGALSSSKIHGIGYQAGAGGAVTQITSRTTGVTLDRATGAITLVSAAGSTSWQTFTLTNALIGTGDTVVVSQKSGTDLNEIHVTAVAAGSCNISFRTTGGTTTEQPVFNFTVIKGSSS